jgi:hypothetical protein
MSDLRRRKYLRSQFQDGDCPDGKNFAELIDSGINQKSDQMFAVDHKLGIGTDEPSAPLEVNGSSGDQKISAVFTDGCNSSLIVGHGEDCVIALGGKQRNDIQLGNFNRECDKFQPHVTVTSEGKVGIGVERPETELHVAHTIKADKHVAIGDAILSFHKRRLWLTANNKHYQILMVESGGKTPGGNKKLMIFLLILCLVNFVAIATIIILYLLGKL